MRIPPISCPQARGRTAAPIGLEVPLFGGPNGIPKLNQSIDAGKGDQWYLDLGAETFRRELDKIGVTDVSFELFDGTHMGIDYRYPLSLKYLAERLSA